VSIAPTGRGRTINGWLTAWIAGSNPSLASEPG
jgi:hypothetical protein